MILSIDMESDAQPISLFDTQADREMKDELATQRVHLDPRLEKSLLTDNEKVTTVRGRMLELLASETGQKEPGGLVKTLEVMSETPAEVNRFKAAVIRATLNSFTISESAVQKLAESKGLSIDKLTKDASWTLVAQLVGVRLTEFMGTHIKKRADPALEPVDTLFGKIWDSTLNVRHLNRKRIANGGLNRVWKEYCELSSQDRLNYSVRIGAAEDDSSRFTLGEGDGEEEITQRSQALANVVDAALKSYFQIKNYSADSGQPLGYLDDDNKRIQLPDDQKEVPIALCIAKDFRTVVKVVNFDRTETDLTKNAQKIADAINGSGGWQEIGEGDRALFAINMTLQDRLLSDEAGDECLQAMAELRPMGVFYEGKHTDGSVRIEYIANHTVMDGIAADIFINGTTIKQRKKDTFGETTEVAHKLDGIKGFYNRGKSEEQKIKNSEYYPDTGVAWEVYRTRQGTCDVVVTRAKKEGSHGADVMQSGVLIANEIFIDSMRELHGGIWNEMENGANNTHVDKDQPFQSLIPGSLYRRHAEKFKKIPGYAQYNEVLSLLTSLNSYKENRWLIDNHEKIRSEPQWQEHNLPASCEAMAVVTESNLPRWVKRALLVMQENELFDKVRYAVTYNQTIVTDKAKPGESDKAATHKTVNNDGLPGVSIREEGEKLEMTFSESENGRLMPPNALEPYAELVTTISLELSQILTKFQESCDAGETPSLKQLNEELTKMKARGRDLLSTHRAALAEKSSEVKNNALR